VEIVAVEEDASIYAWANDEAPAVTPGTPTIYDPLNNPLIQAIGDAQRSITDPPQRLSFKYDYTGTAESGEFSRDLTFSLVDAVGTAVTSGITWTYAVITGTVSGYTSASGSQSMSGSGMGTLTVSSLGSSEAKVEVTATYGGKAFTKQITLTQDVAAPPVAGGGGGGGSSGTLVSKTSGFSSFSTTSFSSVTGNLNFTTPTGVTAIDFNVTLSAIPSASPPSGSWSLECKALVGGVLIGSIQSSASDFDSTDFITDNGTFNFSVHLTGLTASTAYVGDVQCRLVSGSRTHFVNGTVSVTT
jgi:hypothetical protein